MTKRDYCFELKSNLSELNTLCRHLEDCGSMMGLTQRCMSEINLGLDELFTNIISYGFKDNCEHQIKFSLAKENETLVVKVEDDGIPFNPLEVAGPDAAPDIESIKIGGLGIHLVKNMMDDVNYQRVKGKNKLIMKKSVPAASG